MVQGRRLLIAALVTVAAVAAVAGAVLGAREHDSHRREAAPSAWPALVPRQDRAARPPGQGAGGTARRLPRSAVRAGPACSVERKVAQLFLVGFEGTDLNAEIFQRLRRLDLGGTWYRARTTPPRTCSDSWRARRG